MKPWGVHVTDPSSSCSHCLKLFHLNYGRWVSAWQIQRTKINQERPGYWRKNWGRQSYLCCYHLTKEFRWLPLSIGRSRHSFTQMCTSPVVGSFLPVIGKREKIKFYYQSSLGSTASKDAGPKMAWPRDRASASWHDPNWLALYTSLTVSFIVWLYWAQAALWK